MRLLLFFLWYSWFAQIAAQTATVRETIETMPTYPFGDPDPVPKAGRLYPYFRYDGFTDQPQNKDWKVVTLENDWIQVKILPEIGGKIWTAIEKSTGKPFIYYNHSVKFRDVSMRGPWTSGGIEANYGIIGHTPACAVPVNYLTKMLPDGSAACYIGTLDLLTRTYWTLAIVLPPDKAWFSTTSYWHNGTPLEQPYYHWMNVGIKAAGNLEFTYAGRQYLGHAGETAPWRQDAQGRDLAFYEKNDFGSYKSYHVFGRYTDFFGGYWHDEAFGMARYSARDDKPGKKIWIWGLSRQGMIWEQLLTDKDGQYVEVQSGRLFTQSAAESVETPFKYRHFSPAATDTWQEYWFPVKNTKGIKAANSYGALNDYPDPKTGRLTLAFCPLQTATDSLRVYKGNELVYAALLHTKPLATQTIELPLLATDRTQLRVQIGDDRLTLSGDETATNLSRPSAAPRDYQAHTAFAWYQRARAWDDQREYAHALAAYDSCLQRDPCFLPALTGKGTLLYRLQRDSAEAVAIASKALALDTYDPAANYLWGLLHRGYDAKDGFELAAQSAEYRAAAYLELARLWLAEDGRAAQAQLYAEKSLRYNQMNSSALQILAALSRRAGQTVAAHRYREQLLSLDPLNHFVRAELWLEARTAAARTDFTNAIRDELPHQTYLELAEWYHRFGFRAEALAVLEIAPDGPEKHLLMAYWNPKARESALDLAQAASPAFFFPFRHETLAAIRMAAASRQHWKFAYYMGLTDLYAERSAAALVHWDACGEQPDFAPFYIARSQLRRTKRPAEAEQDLLRARMLAPNEWRTGLYLARFYQERKRPEAVLAVTRTAFAAFPDHYILGMEHARALLATKRYAECVALLDTLHVIPYEGATDGRALYRNAHLLYALQRIKEGNAAGALASVAASRQWPEHLGVGKPYDADIDTRVEAYLEALALEASGNQRAARAALEQAAVPASHGYLPSDYVRALALRRLGRSKEAFTHLDAWLQHSPNDATARWAKQRFAQPKVQEKAPLSEHAALFDALE